MFTGSALHRSYLNCCLNFSDTSNHINDFPDIKLSRLSKKKKNAFAHDKLYLGQTLDFSKRREKKKYGKLVRKGENAGSKRIFLNPFPNKPWFLRVCSISLLKTHLEKENLLETSNFSFSHSVFYRF